MNNKRNYFRHSFSLPLCGELSIVSIKGNAVETKNTYVCIHDMSAGGLRFESHLKLIVHDQVVIQIATTLCNVPVKLLGIILRSNEMNNGYFEYAMKFLIDEVEHNQLVRLINETHLKAKRRSKIPGCSVCTGNTPCQKNMDQICSPYLKEAK